MKVLDPDWVGYTWLMRLGAFLLGIATIYVLIAGPLTGGGALVVLLALGIIITIHESRLPALFGTLFMLAALINAAGFIWSFFARIPFFDEAAHLYTSFAITLALGFLFYSDLMNGFRRHRIMFVVTITSMGIAIGVLWEFCEWIIEIVFEQDSMLGNITDTMADLALDSTGAFLASLLNLRGINDGHAKPGQGP